MDEKLTISDVYAESRSKPKADDWDEPYRVFSESGGDTQALSSVVKSLDPVISSAVKTYGGPKAPPTLRSRAKILAARAVKSYDPGRGANLKTHVYNQLRALQRIAPEVVDPLPPPERFRRQQAEISTALSDLEDSLGREPTDEEVSEHTGIPLSRTSKVRARMRARIPMTSFEEGDDDDDTGQDVVGSTRTDYDDWAEAVFHDLGHIDKLIMQYRTGYGGADKLNNMEIASRVGISPAAVSQRARRIQARLDEFYGA